MTDQRIELPYRETTRLKEFDYSTGWFFVTACCANGTSYFGKIESDGVSFSAIGKIAHEEWIKGPLLRKELEIDYFVVMPNHFHAILSLGSGKTKLGSLMSQFKSAVTKKAAKDLGFTGELWQRGFYDRIIRSEQELSRIRAYIENNPLKWSLDRENPDRIGNNKDEDPWFA